MKRLVILSLLLFITSFIYCQYLEVSRSATIKEQPISDDIILERVSIGDYLSLLDNGQQTNGYYKVKCKKTDQEGWIYRTLVRRYDGVIPVADDNAISEDATATVYGESILNLF